MPAFRLEITTPERKLYEGNVVSLQAPGLDGSFGILYNRAPIIAALGPGPVRIVEEGAGEQRLAISGGFFEVRGNRAVILADKAEFAAEIDPRAAEAELDAAKAAMLRPSASETEREERRQALLLAQARVRVAGARR